MKIVAGARLKSQNPAPVPAESAASEATKNCWFTAAANAKKTKAIVLVPTARPSILSKKFVALKMRTIQKTVISQLTAGMPMNRVIETPPQVAVTAAIRI